MSIKFLVLGGGYFGFSGGGGRFCFYGRGDFSDNWRGNKELHRTMEMIPRPSVVV